MKAYRTEFITLLAAFGLLSLLAFASSAVAADDLDRRAAFSSSRILTERMADRLELDDAQRESVKAIVEAAEPQFQALRESVQQQIAAVLTAEQLAELETMKQRTRGEGRRGKR